MSYTLPELCKDFSCETCCVVHRFAGINCMFMKIALAPSVRCVSMEMLMDECRPGISAAFDEIIKKRIKCKVNFAIQVLFQKINFLDDTVVAEDRGYMSLDAIAIQTASDVDDTIESAIVDLQEKIDTYTNKGSNWIVGGIEQLILSLVAYK